MERYTGGGARASRAAKQTIARRRTPVRRIGHVVPEDFPADIETLPVTTSEIIQVIRELEEVYDNLRRPRSYLARDLHTMYSMYRLDFSHIMGNDMIDPAVKVRTLLDYWQQLPVRERNELFDNIVLHVLTPAQEELRYRQERMLDVPVYIEEDDDEDEELEGGAMGCPMCGYCRRI